MFMDVGIFLEKPRRWLSYPNGMLLCQSNSAGCAQMTSRDIGVDVYGWMLSVHLSELVGGGGIEHSYLQDLNLCPFVEGVQLNLA